MNKNSQGGLPLGKENEEDASKADHRSNYNLTGLICLSFIKIF